MLTLISASFATTEQMFSYKENNFTLSPFPGYTKDQWGIKAHNRPWIDSVGEFKKGEKIIEIGGAYSTLPEYLAKKYQLEAWIGDDFGLKSNDKRWFRWEDPKKHIKKHKKIKYILEPLGTYSKKYPDNYFDKVFSVSTLEHIGSDTIIDVFKDMNRITKKGGMQMHTIDIGATTIKKALVNTLVDQIPFSEIFLKSYTSEIKRWENVLKSAGIKINTKFPKPTSLLNKSILAESPDVVFRFYPPNNQAKQYSPSASLLLIIKDL